MAAPPAPLRRHLAFGLAGALLSRLLPFLASTLAARRVSSPSAFALRQGSCHLKEYAY